jgi:methylglutamate dehydrogenase subunit D
MADRISALAGHYRKGFHGPRGVVGVKMQDMVGLEMHQIAAWPDTINDVGAIAAESAGASAAPGPRQAAVGSNGTLLRIEPLKWWLFGAVAPELDPESGNTLDVSHSRTHLRITGPDASEFLNRHVSLDLRDESFSVGSVGSTVIHHVGVTLWRSDNGYELFLPRGFALTLWEGFVESAAQFGLEVVPAG